MSKEHAKLNEDQMSGYFRANVGAVIINGDGLVFAAERSKIPGAWQLPQGGINLGEKEEQAVLREIQEELGFDERDIGNLLQRLPKESGWFAYQLPEIEWSGKNGRGQTQKFFAYRFVGLDKQLDERFEEQKKQKKQAGKEIEFGDWKWERMSDLTEKAWPIRRPVYEAVERAFSEYLA